MELVLLDNVQPADTRTAVELARPAAVRLEAGGPTHSAPVLDLGFDLRD